MRRVSIILLWWSRTPDLEKMSIACLESILKNTEYPEYEVIVIENDSMCSPSQYLIDMKDPRVIVATQSENLAFCKGNNVGIKMAGTNDVLLLNNDILVPKGWLEPIMRVATIRKDVGMVMPVQVHKASNEYLKFDGDVPKLMEYLDGVLASNKDKDLDSQMTEGNWLPLCATLITRETIDEVGVLDEFFHPGGFEDVDYSWRCLDVKRKLYLTNGSRIFHYYGQSFHFHEGLAEKWVDKGKYLMTKHDATQATDNASFRIKDKSESWYRKCAFKIKQEDLDKFAGIFGPLTEEEKTEAEKLKSEQK